MKKANTLQSQIVDAREADKLCVELTKCARCLDGDNRPSCSFSHNCDEHVMNTMVRAVEISETCKRRMAPKTRETVLSRVKGFRYKNVLTKEYRSKVSISLASTAKELQISVDILTGRDTF